MLNLERRVTMLESANPPAEELTNIRRIVWPGHLDAEIDHIRDDDGKEWTRQPGESETAFTERAISETKANRLGIKGLISTNRELDHANH